MQASMSSQSGSRGGEMGSKHTHVTCWVVWLVIAGSIGLRRDEGPHVLFQGRQS